MEYSIKVLCVGVGGGIVEGKGVWIGFNVVEGGYGSVKCDWKNVLVDLEAQVASSLRDHHVEHKIWRRSYISIYYSQPAFVDIKARD